MLVAEVTQWEYILGFTKEPGAANSVFQAPGTSSDQDAKGRTGVVRRGAE
jgi:hypothetical protein